MTCRSDLERIGALTPETAADVAAVRFGLEYDRAGLRVALLELMALAVVVDGAAPVRARCACDVAAAYALRARQLVYAGTY